MAKKSGQLASPGQFQFKFSPLLFKTQGIRRIAGILLSKVLNLSPKLKLKLLVKEGNKLCD